MRTSGVAVVIIEPVASRLQLGPRVPHDEAHLGVERRGRLSARLRGPGEVPVSVVNADPTETVHEAVDRPDERLACVVRLVVVPVSAVRSACRASVPRCPASMALVLVTSVVVNAEPPHVKVVAAAKVVALGEHHEEQLVASVSHHDVFPRSLERRHET